MNLDLPPEIEGAMQQAARQQGQTPEEAVTTALRRLFASPGLEPRRPLTHPFDPAATVALLDSFDQDDEEEQRETLNTLIKALDRDRPGQRRIFGECVSPMPSPGETRL